MVSGNSVFTGLTQRKSLRTMLLAGAATGLPLFAAAAQAQEVTIDDDRTTPIETATVNGGSNADVEITSDGSVKVDSGTAVTLNSDNELINGGEIEVGHVDNATGVLIMPGFEGEFGMGGSILLDRTEEQTDANADDEVVDYADNRRGIWLQSGGVFTGDIATGVGSAVEVFGDESYAIDLAGDLDGNFSVADLVGVAGVNSVGIAVQGTVTGNVITQTGSEIFNVGEDSVGILLNGTVNGAFIHGGSLTSTAYLDDSVDTDEDNDNDIQAGLQARAGIEVTGNLDGGFLINGAIPSSERPDDYVTPSTASVTMNGSGPAIWIHDGAVLGEVDTTAQSDAYGDWGFINRGTITARGIYSGIDATGVLIEDATIVGGVRNDATMRASSYNGNATAFHLGTGGSLEEFYNYNSMESSVSSDNGATVDSIALHVDSGASLPKLTNFFQIRAGTTGDNSSATAILDESGTLTEIVNQGAIQTVLIDFADEDNTPATGSAVAIDVSANTTGVSVHNTVRDSFDEETEDRSDYGIIDGDILFGSGSDQFLSDAGRMTGDIDFGAGDDLASISMGSVMNGNMDFGAGNNTLGLDDGIMFGDVSFGAGTSTFDILNGSFYRGDISSTGMLDVTVSGGSTLYETGADVTNVSNFFVGSASTLGIGISEDGATATSFNVSNLATLQDGATIQPVFLGGAIETLSADIVIAGDLVVDPDALVVGDAEGNRPYLFNITFDTSTDTDTGNEILTLNVQRRTAEELGLQSGLAPAYVPTLEALATDPQLGQIVLNFTQEEDFRDALSQLLAGPLDAPLAYAQAQNNSVTSIITQRLDLARNSGEYPRTFWIQEENYFLNRDSDEVSNGFDGGGFSLAAGVDAGLDNFVDAVGLSFSMSSAKYDEKKGGDFPFERLTYGVGAYAAFSAGPLQFDTRGEYAVTSSESERNIDIGNVSRTAVGEWDGTQIAASARLRYMANLFDGWTAEPFVSADILRIEEDAYEETGGGNGIDLAVSDRTYESLRANAGLRLGKVFELRPSAYDTGIPGTLHPQLTVAWSQELNDDPLEAEYRYISGGDAFTLFANPEDGAAILGADIAYENEYAKVHIGMSGTVGSDTEALILRAGVGLKW